MIHMLITSPQWCPEESAVKHVRRAEFKIDGSNVWIEGDAHYTDLSLPIIEPDTKRRLLFHDDPELWATNLPFAYRSGDIVAEVVESQALVPVGARA